MAFTKDQLDAYIQALYDDDGQLSSADYQLIINYILSNGEPETNPRDLIQIRRGSKPDLPLLALGELALTTDTEDLFVGGLNGNVKISNAKTIKSVYEYGVKGDGITDDTVNLQNAIDDNIGGSLFIPKASYKLTETVEAKCTLISDGAILKFYGGTIGTLVSQNTELSLLGFRIDGLNVDNCQYGLFVDTDFVQQNKCSYDLKISNIKNTDNTLSANGALFFKATTANVNLNSYLDIKIDVENVQATANGVVGDTGGSAAGVIVSFNGVGTNSNVTIRDSFFKNITPSEDANGLVIFTGDYKVSTAKGHFLVTNCEAISCAKRGFKVQAPNVTIENCVSEGSNMLAGFETYSFNTSFIGCKHLNGDGISFTSEDKNTIIQNCVSETSSVSGNIVLYPGASSVIIENVKIKNSAIFPTNDSSFIRISDSTGKLSKVFVEGNGTGSAINCLGTSNIEIENSNFNNVLTGVLLDNTIGEIGINNTKITAVGTGVSKKGTTGSTVKIKNSKLSAQVCLLLVGSGFSSKAVIDGSELLSTIHGVFADSGSRITNNTIKSTLNNGFGISAGNSVSRNNQITNFEFGIDYSFTTTAEVSNNVTIGTTTPFVKTGFTAFVDHDNYSR